MYNKPQHVLLVYLGKSLIGNLDKVPDLSKQSLDKIKEVTIGKGNRMQIGMVGLGRMGANMVELIDREEKSEADE